MATILSMPHSAPSENWDDDFEFQQNLARKNPPNETPSHSRNSSHTYPKQPQLTNWVEPGPSTPSKRPLNEENWDDDFEDKTDSPVQKSASARQMIPSSSLQQENWDEDFDLSPAKSVHKQHYSSAAQPIFDDDDDEDDDMDFNNLDKEEDRTVTARSRRAISRVNETPPPPVPPIPFSFLTTTNSREQPFPRSPTASVFSVPTSGRDSVAYSYTSTSHLRPTISRSSITGFANLPPSPPIHKERERRRLRKKSRPQDPATMEMHTRAAYNYPGAFTMNSSQESIRESDGELEPRPVTPRRSPSPAATPDPAVTMSPPRNNRNSVSSSSGLPSPPSRTPLLSRIGSVKKWGVRKKRASSTPSETILQEAERQAETEQQENRTRPPSAAGLPAPSTPSSKPWFFRASSGSGAVNTPAQKFEVNDHQTPKASARTAKKSDLPPFDTPSKLVKRKSLGFVPLRPRNGPVNDDVEDLPPPPPSRNSTLGSTSDLPSDLEAELGLDSDVAAGRSPSKKKKKNRQSLANPPPQQPRHGSYGGIGLGRAPDARRSTEDFESRRNTPRSSSRSKSRDRRAEKESANRDESEGSRNFMGSVRRISFVGKHKRTKSGVSLSSVAEGLKKSLDRRRETSDDAMDVDDNQPPPPSGSGLLPPIELSPPSPPQIASGSTIGLTAHEDSLDLDALPPPPSSSSSSNFSSPSLLLKSSTGTVKPPLTASLGRSTIVPVMIASSSMPASSSNVPRRNSLGDLKIPARISQAQVGLRRDLGMVKEFATNVEQLKNLQTIYHNLVVEMQSILDAHAHQVSSRAASPIFRPLSRMRSNTSGAAPSPTHDSYKHLAAAFYTINSKYKIAWECAELLIELGGGSSETAPNSPPSTSISAPTMMAAAISSNQSKKSRERAITLSGEQSKPGTPTPGSYASDSSSPPLVNAPNMAWRASTGRHDLNQRQLLLLREMLNNSNSSFVTENTQSPIVEDPPTAVNREWRWGGDGMNSTITLPSEESSTVPSADAGKKRRSSRLKGMRDMLRSLTKNQAANTSPVPPSTTSLSTESSKDSQHRYPHDKVPTYGRRRAKTSSGPDAASSVRERDRDVRSKSPYTATSLSVKASPRRPSLASIFRIGGKSKPSPTPSAMGSSGGISTDNVNVHTRESSGTTSDDEEDWDRLEYPYELDGTTRARAVPSTIRGRSPYMPETQLPPLGTTTPNRRSASNSQTSLWAEPPSSSPVGVPARATRLSNVEENADDARASKTSLKRTGSSPVHSRKVNKTGSVRSMPPQPLFSDRLAMTPENIKPLLENAREVHARLTDCIGEIRTLIAD